MDKGEVKIPNFLGAGSLLAIRTASSILEILGDTIDVKDMSTA